MYMNHCENDTYWHVVQIGLNLQKTANETDKGDIKQHFLSSYCLQFKRIHKKYFWEDLIPLTVLVILSLMY
jgi:hypothetical protein